VCNVVVVKNAGGLVHVVVWCCDFRAGLASAGIASCFNCTACSWY
jgi:hypothetical protein